jgi:hypothetical protein
MNPDRSMASKLRQAVAGEGEQLADLHLWRLGPGHLADCFGRCGDTARGRLLWEPSRLTSLSQRLGLLISVAAMPVTWVFYTVNSDDSAVSY